MYYRHFGLNGPPFPLTPDTECFYPGAGRGEILAAMQHALLAGAGILKLTGEVGSGKTMLARMLMERLAGRMEIVYLANPSLERNDIHQAIALELGIEAAPGDPRVQLLSRIQQRLIDIHRQGRSTVVFIEEAQGMPPESLEEVRYLSNLETSSARMLQIVLIGQPELDGLLARCDLRQLDDRIAHGFFLPPLTREEVRDYLLFRLRRAGHPSGELFTAGACRLLHRASGGRLRRLHVIADKALLAAYASGASRVLPCHVRRARRDREAPVHRVWLSPLRMAAASFGVAGAAGMFALGLFSPGVSIGMAVPEPAASEERPQAMAPLAASSEPTVFGEARLRERLEALAELDLPGDRRYAIQLATSHDRNLSALAEFLSPLPDPLWERLYLYPVRIGGRERYSVVLGGFDSLAEARDTMERLPQTLRRYRPYIRSLTAVRIEAGLGRGEAPL